MKKILKISAVVVLSILAIGLAVNWYLTNRLENKLREIITRQVSDATNGFYHFTYKKLDIGFFSGELRLQEAELTPDSLVLDRLTRSAGLPETYFDINVDLIHLKGINLTWRRDYKELDFTLLEIKNPNVFIYGEEKPLLKTPSKETTPVHLDPDRFYLVIAPYINELNIRKVNLERATVIYKYLKRDASQAVYSLKNINFNCYHFLLNKESANSGKLLFCDNFEFRTNQTQKLLDDSRFALDVSEIYLSTQDSIIRINGATLTPKLLSSDIEESAINVIQARIDSVRLKGAYFYRQNRLSHLEADSFKIMSSDIFFFNKKKEDSIPKTDSVKPINPWSLNTIVSPVIKSVAIKNISIDNAKMNYWISTKKQLTDKYQMQSFNFDAHGFRIQNDEPTDSFRLLYSDDILIRASEIEGQIASKNHNAGIGLFEFNTENKTININNVSVSPITTKTNYDYINGHLQFLNLKNVIYKNDMTVENLTIIKPKLEYVRVQGGNQEKSPKQDESKSKNINIIESFVDVLTIKKIDLLDGSVTFNNQITENKYTLENFNFSVNKFSINKDIPKDITQGLQFGKLGFNFNNFDNLSPDKAYRLKVSAGYLDNKVLTLTDIEVIPQDTLLNNPYRSNIQISAPAISLHGDFVKLINNDTLDINYLRIDQPKVTLKQAGLAKSQSKEKTKSELFPFSYIHLDSLQIPNLRFTLNDSTSEKQLDMSLNNLQIDSFTWDMNHFFRVNKIRLHAPQITYHSKGSPAQIKKDAADIPNAFLEQEIEIKALLVSDPTLNYSNKTDKILIHANGISINDYHSKLLSEDSYLNIGSFEFGQPTIRTNLSAKNQKPKTGLPQQPDTSFYNKLKPFANNIQLNKLAVTNLNVLNIDTAESPKIKNASLILYGAKVDNVHQQYALSGIDLHTENINIPLDNGFYTLSIDNIDLLEKGNRLKIDDIKLHSPFSKMDFAYQHHKNKDWFDVTVGTVEAKGMNIPDFLKNKRLNIDQVTINNTSLENFKNQQIEVPVKIVPMIYEGIQNLPFDLTINHTNIHNFNVTYEELAKKGTHLGKIFFTNMNGQLSGLTNRATSPNQFIHLEADGKFMGKGHVDATWLLPVEKQNDRFLLHATLSDFDLKELNQLVTPLFPAAVRRGHVNSVTIAIDASSIEANIQMQLLYTNLVADLLKEKNGELKRKPLLSWLANIIIRNNNPRKTGKNPRISDLQVTRDPYHSTFNYFWQIIRPAAIEAVGVSEKVQKIGKDNIFTRLKAKFKNKKKEKTEPVHTH